jgi:hypothetical protein
VRDDDQPTTARALWLLDLAEALDEAERLTGALARSRPGSRDAILLRSRIKAARAEVEALRHGLGDPAPLEIDPLWTPRSTPRHDQTP